MAVAPELAAVLAKIEKDVLADLVLLLIPGIEAEIEVLSPAGAQSIEKVVFGSVNPAAQAAFASIVAKVVPA